MPPLSIPCPHCSQASQIDSDRLPDQPARFACPHCKGDVVVDKRRLLGTPTASAAPTSASPPAAAPAPAETPAPAASAASAAPSTPAADRRFARVPEDAVFPSGIILGEDDALISQIQEKLAALGSETERMASPDAARQVILSERPELCIYVGGNITAPPYAPVAPLAGLSPAFRRRLFVVLVADNLKTLDGNAAFMYQVDMVLGKPDLPHFADALYSGIDHHRRLYKEYFLAAEKHWAM